MGCVAKRGDVSLPTVFDGGVAMGCLSGELSVSYPPVSNLERVSFSEKEAV